MANAKVHLQALSFDGKEKWVNLFRRISTFGSTSYGTFVFNLKPSLSEKFLVGRGAKVAPVHGLAEEVIFGISRSIVVPCHRKQKEATRPKPLCKSVKEVLVLLSRDMEDGVKADNCIEATCGEFGLHYVGDDEFGCGYVFIS